MVVCLFMFMNMKDRTVKIILIIILFLALFLRVYKIDQVPPSLMWDEAAVGYNAFAIANYGKDEWGEMLPLAFKSFEEYKMPIHIYITALFVKVGGLNEITTRLPSAIFGFLSVLVIYFLVKKLFDNKYAGLVGAFLLAVSPYSVHFSRFAHEANFATFFFLLALLLFFISIRDKSNLLILSTVCFGLSLISYNAAKILVPPLLLLLVLFYLKELLVMKKNALISLTIFFIFILTVIFYPGLSGKSRVEQTGLNIKDVNVIKERYLSHFSLDYLIKQGDKNPKLGVQVTGQSNYLEVFLLSLGILASLVKRARVGFFLLTWLLLAPIPATIFGGESEVPHAARASFSIGVWQVMAAYGVISLINILSIIKSLKSYAEKFIFLVIIISLAIFTKNWYFEYLKDYKEFAIEWQYGIKQIVEYIKEHDYSQIYMTDIRSQPYIFFLYYLKTPLPEFLKTVEYNKTEYRSSNLVSFYDKYFFGWDEIESQPTPGVLFVLGPSKYDGLRQKQEFNVKKIIYYPNGTVAFYLVSVY